MTTELKLCKDCKHVQLKQSLMYFDKCTLSYTVDPFGDTGKRFTSCPVVRNFPDCDNYCGPEGKNFVQNTSFWYKLKKLFRKPL